MYSGANYQSRVVAYAAVKALAEEASTPVFGLDGPPVRILCEPQADVDDIHVHAARGVAFVQAKKTVSFSTDPASPFGKAMTQFVTQFMREGFDPAEDTLVLVSEDMSSRLTDDLLPIIRRLRTVSDDVRLTEAPASQAQHRALADVRGLLDEIANEDSGPELMGDDLREFLSRVELVELSFGDHGDGEREARNLLRGSVLTDPADAETAWKLLVETGARLCEGRASISQTDLEDLLHDEGLQLQSVRSVERDVEKLEEWTQRTLERLARFDRIVIGDQEFSLQRPYAEAVLQGADDGNIAVTGEPGAGKTGCLVETVRLARGAGRPCVFVSADELDVPAAGVLRQVLGLEHRVPEVLRGWRGKEPGLLVVDGLDALRGGDSGRALTQLLQEVTRRVEGWNVVVSIREHDLRRGPSYWKLFPGEPLSAPVSPLPDPDLADVRHLVVPGFSDEEIARVRERCEALGLMLDHASDSLRSLLRNPFNLDLAADLVGAGLGPEEVAGLRSQTDLLDAWWSERVVAEGVGRAEERQHVLREGLTAMAGSRRLRAPRSAFRDSAASSQPLTDLLSAQVLVEWRPLPAEPPDESLLAFKHHIVFDYAAARVYLAGTLRGSLEDDPGLVVFLRPSIEMYFRRLWDRSTGRFWEQVLEISSSDEIHQIAKAIGPSVAAERAGAVDDLVPLLDALEAVDEDVQGGAANAFNHLAGALLLREDGPRSDGFETWPATLERISTSLSTDTANRVLQLLRWALDLPRTADSTEATARLGRAARNLLDFCWTDDVGNPGLGAAALQLVAQTYETDPASSRELLEQVIAPDRLVARGADELWPLAKKVPQLWEASPEFVRNIYAAAFAHQETSEESKTLGTPVIPLTSTRKQNFRMGQWKLKEEFPDFLAAAPLHATSAAVAVVEEQARDKWWSRIDEPEEHEFPFRGRQARVAVDHSASWGQRTARPDEDALQVFEALESHLRRLADSGDRAAIGEIIDVVAQDARAAVVWGRLLKLGANKPDTIGRELVGLLCAKPILMLSDTSRAACDLLEALHPVLEADERRRIEETILSLGREAGEAPDRRKTIVERMVGHLGQEHIVTDTARRLAQELAEGGQVPTNEPPAKVRSFSREWTEEDELRERGVDLDDPANAALRELIAPVEDFARPNETPERDEAIDVLPAVRALHEALGLALSDGVHPELDSRGWGVLAAGLKRCSRCEELDCTEDEFAFVRSTVLEAAIHEHPEPSEPSEAWERSPHWSSPVPRTEAAQALCYLARKSSCADDELMEAIRCAADDPHHEVRYQVARLVHFVAESRPHEAWQIITTVAREETSAGIVAGLLSGPLPHLAGGEPGRVADLTSTILTRTNDGPDCEKVRERCAALLGDLHVWGDVDRASQVVAEIVADPGRFLVEAKTLAGHFREVLVSDHSDGQPRARVVSLLQQLVRSTRAEMEERLSEDGTLESSEEEEFQSLMQILDSVGSALFFVSGALAARKDEPDDEDFQPTDAERCRLYDETEEILEDLSDVGIPRLAHNLVQTLEMFVPCDPQGVFLKLAAVIRGGKRGGYQYDPMAEETMVRLVERYLAEHRGLLQRHRECESALAEILDVFLVAGSTEAQRLTYRLDNIYR